MQKLNTSKMHQKENEESLKTGWYESERLATKT